MKIWKINNEDEFVKAHLSMFEKGSVNMMGNDTPLFDSVDHFIEYYNIQDNHLDKIFDNDGNPKWDSLNESLPIEWLKEVLDIHRLYAYPFYIVIDGHHGFIRDDITYSCWIKQVRGLEN